MVKGRGKIVMGRRPEGERKRHQTEKEAKTRIRENARKRKARKAKR